jgi:hypothetical protein
MLTIFSVPIFITELSVKKYYNLNFHQVDYKYIVFFYSYINIIEYNKFFKNIYKIVVQLIYILL